MSALWATAIPSIVITSLALTTLHPLLLRWGVLDVPNHRSSHDADTVRSGGIGLLAGIVGASLLATRPDSQMFVMLSAIALLTFLGLAEDLKGLSISSRMAGQGLIALFLTLGLIKPRSIIEWLVLLVALLGVVFYINAANFMDGINSISALHGCIAGTYYTVLGISANHDQLSIFSVALASSFLSFLPWNAPVAKLFLGDSGSYLLGGCIAGLAGWCYTLGIQPIVCVAPLIVYTADVLRTLIYRARLKHALSEAHRDHVYQQLQRLMRSHLASSAACTGATIVCCLAALIVYRESKNWPYSTFITAFAITAYLASPRITTMITRKEIPQ